MEAIPKDESMALSPREIRWAQEIKEAVRGSDPREDDDNDGGPLKELSDFEYCQHALTSKGDTAKALERIRMMQHFREEYKITDTAEEGAELLEAFIHQQPWFLLSVDYIVEKGHFVVIYDNAKLNPSAVNYPEDWRICLGGFYYIAQVLQANLSACRQGAVQVGECEGMGNANFNKDFVLKSWYHLLRFYPMIDKEVFWLHTSLIGNIQYAFFKSLLQGEKVDAIRVGCHFEGQHGDGRIDGMFKTPTEDVAACRLLTSFKAYLNVRYHYQQAFQLPALDPTEGAVAND